jgi:hypothetical protein
LRIRSTICADTILVALGLLRQRADFRDYVACPANQLVCGRNGATADCGEAHVDRGSAPSRHTGIADYGGDHRGRKPVPVPGLQPFKSYPAFFPVETRNIHSTIDRHRQWGKKPFVFVPVAPASVRPMRISRVLGF